MPCERDDPQRSLGVTHNQHAAEPYPDGGAHIAAERWSNCVAKPCTFIITHFISIGDAEPGTFLTTERSTNAVSECGTNRIAIHNTKPSAVLVSERRADTATERCPIVVTDCVANITTDPNTNIAPVACADIEPNAFAI